MPDSHSNNHNPLLAAWREQIERARTNPFLFQLLLKQWQRVLKRLAYFYAQLASLPRRNRRALQRALATSLVGAAMLLALSSAPLAFANNLSVDKNDTVIADDGFCSLAEAIVNANNDSQLYASAGECPTGDPGLDTITLTTDVTLGAMLSNITTEITLEGNNFYVSGANAFRVFTVLGTGDFTINDTTVKYGYIAGNGGGIFSRGTLELNDSTVSGSNANDGGGIYVLSGVAILNNSTVSGNSANQGGGIFAYDGQATINNSTVSGNDATSDGGGIYVYEAEVTLNNSTVSGNDAGSGGGGIYVYEAKVTLNNSTLSSNTALNNGGAFYSLAHSTVTITNSTFSDNSAVRGGAIFNDRNATTNLNRSLLSGNTATQNGDEIFNYSGGTINATNFNLFGYSGITNAAAFVNFTPGATDFNATSDGDGVSTHVPTALASILDTTLALNGNPNGTLTHALVSGSPAIDKAPNADCTAAPINDVDQRGFPRNVDIMPPPTANDCDIGAFELQAATAVNVKGVRGSINKNGDAVIRWRTTTENQIAGFNVYRKTARSEWKQINADLKQAKHAGSAEGDKYRFVDKHARASRTYRYKIQIVYLDGHTEWTKVVRVQAP